MATAIVHGPATPVECWRDRYRQRVETATDAGDLRILQRLRGFGVWSTIFVDFLLLVLFEFTFSILLLLVCAAIIGTHNGDFSHGIFQSDGLSKAFKSTLDWTTSPYGLAVAGFVTQVAIFTTIYMRIVAPRILTWADLGFGPSLRDRPGRALMIGVGAAVTAIVASALIVAILQALKLPVNGQEDTLKPLRHASLLQKMVVGISVVITAPIAEETFFRGYMLRALAVKYGLVPGIVVTSIEFGALHLLGGVTWEFIAIGVVGAILAVAYAWTGNILANVTGHALFNTLGLIVLFKG